MNHTLHLESIWKGGVIVTKPRVAKDERVWQFIGYCKKCLRYEKIDYVEAQQVSFDKEIPLDFIGYIGVYPDDFEIENMLQVMNFEIAIKNDLFYDVLIKFKKRDLDIQYLSACEDMSDSEISKELHIPRSTVQYHKTKTKEQIRKMMGEKQNER